MKWMHSHPEHSKFTFSNAQKITDFAKENDMYLLGHTLVWHNQVPDYVSKIEDKSKFNLHVKNHIFQLVTRFKGKVDMWDVVNEALNDDGTLRETIFLEMMGDNYIEKSFQYANDTDPNVELAYNDYNLWKPKKRKGAIKIINSLKDKGTEAISIHTKNNNSIKTIPEAEELGFVGIPNEINNEQILNIINQNKIPIISPLGLGKENQTYNINGDTAAMAIAKSLKSRRLLLMTNVDGVLDKNKKLIEEISSSEVLEMIKDETITEGMIPKINACLDAVNNGVTAVGIINGTKPHSCLWEIFSDKGSGTLIRQ